MLRFVEDSAATEPTLANDSSACCTLRLPAAFHAEIEKRVPGFRLWRMEEYVPDAISGYELKPRQAPFAVVADFDGDGAADVVIQGRTDGEEVRVVLLGRRAASPAFFELKRDSIYDPRASVVLHYVPPQRLGGPDEPAMQLRHDAFEAAGIDAATVYYFDRGKFVPYQTSN